MYPAGNPAGIGPDLKRPEASCSENWPLFKTLYVSLQPCSQCLKLYVPC